MAPMMLEKRQRQFIGTVMRAVVHEQIPGIGHWHARNERAACDQIDQRETNPYLPKNCEDRVVGVGMM
jgi:hypothetical protein